MTPDPMDALRLPPTPVDPRLEFTSELRQRLERALGPVPPGGTMTTTTTPTHIPERLHAVTPYLAVSDARAAMAWYQDVFGATIEHEPIVMDDGRIGHVELRIGDAVIMMADEFAEIEWLGPQSRGGTTVSFVVHVPDADAVYARAVETGARAERPISEQYGSRSGWIVDPWGHRWNVSTALEAITAPSTAEGDELPVVDLGERAPPGGTAT